jgi:hypothetical protein
MISASLGERLCGALLLCIRTAVRLREDALQFGHHKLWLGGQ